MSDERDKRVIGSDGGDLKQGVEVLALGGLVGGVGVGIGETDQFSASEGYSAPRKPCGGR